MGEIHPALLLPTAYSSVVFTCFNALPCGSSEDHPLVTAYYYWGAVGSVAVGEQGKEIEGGGNLGCIVKIDPVYTNTSLHARHKFFLFKIFHVSFFLKELNGRLFLKYIFPLT